MTKFNYVFDGLIDTVLVFDAHVRNQLTYRVIITEYKRYARSNEFMRHALSHRGGHHRDAANATFSEFSHHRLGSVLIVLSVAYQHIVPSAPGCSLITPNNFREIWICDFGNDQAKDVAAAGRKASGMNVLEIIELANNFQDATAGVFGNVLCVIEYPRNGGQGHSSSPRNFAHRVGHKKPLVSPP